MYLFSKNISVCLRSSGIPRDISFTVVQDTFKSVEGIVAIHNLRIWGLTTDKTALAAHLVIGKPGLIGNIDPNDSYKFAL